MCWLDYALCVAELIIERCKDHVGNERYPKATRLFRVGTATAEHYGPLTFTFTCLEELATIC